MSKILRKYGTALMVISPSVSAALVCFYGCIGWMIYISFTRSKLLPNYEWVGLLQYQRLMSDDRWHTSLFNLLVFGGTLIVSTLSLGALMAIFLDQKVRIEGLLRTVYMYPLSISYVVTGLVWQWLLNPEFGFQKLMRDLGFTSFEFNWLADQDFAIFTVAIAAVWHGSGLVMAILLAGLRGIDPSIWQASRIDGIKPWRMYFHVILPMLAPVVATCVVLQALGALRAYDLVVAITGGGPGYASDLPGKFVVDYAGERANLGLAAAAAVEMLAMLALLVLPYIVFNRRKPKN